MQNLPVSTTFADMLKSDFLYDLPEDRIAKAPLAQRDQSKLLVVKDGNISHQRFVELPELLPEDTQLVFNNTRVVRARLFFIKTEGAKPIEVFCLGPHKQSVEEAMTAKGTVQFECLVGNAKRWKDHPLTLALEDGSTLTARKVFKDTTHFVIEFEWDSAQEFSSILEMAGNVPIPPYMNRAAEASDIQRYQTVYAQSNGSVAAPTAGLHFTPDVLQQLDKNGHQRLECTLHVGAGTFRPLEEGAVADHEMHAEQLTLAPDFIEALIAHQGQRFAVGTTATRTLESAYWIGVKLYSTGVFEDLQQNDAYTLPQDIPVDTALQALATYLNAQSTPMVHVKTQLMIRPGYTFRTINGVVTNFHQPGSTLLLLVSAGIGPLWKTAYTEALKKDYRFLSYGDSSLLYFK